MLLFVEPSDRHVKPNFARNLLEKNRRRHAYVIHF